jgi:hypothetical protein
MPTLDGAQLKLARATRHLDELRDVVRKYLDSGPYRVLRREDDSGDLVYSLQIVEAIPAEWGAVVGDAVHNLRSALDLLAWQLVKSGGVQPTKVTFFPISRTSTDFEHALKRCLRGAPPSALRFVRRLRPYSGGNDKLVRLHTLDIVDKHRVILIVGAAHRNVVLNFRMPVPWQQDPIQFPPLPIRPADRQFPLCDGAELYRVKATARSSEICDEPRFTFEFCLGDEGNVRGLPLVETLELMQKHVSRVLGIADRFLL